MSNARAKGLAACREVKKILQESGYKVEGPGYGIMFIEGKSIPVHKDYFGCLDLISYRRGEMLGHQVTDLNNKAAHLKKMEGAGIEGWVWCRTKNGRKVEWRVFYKGIEIPIKEV